MQITQTELTPAVNRLMHGSHRVRVLHSDIHSAVFVVFSRLLKRLTYIVHVEFVHDLTPPESRKLKAVVHAWASSFNARACYVQTPAGLTTANKRIFRNFARQSQRRLVGITKALHPRIKLLHIIDV